MSDVLADLARKLRAGSISLADFLAAARPHTAHTAGAAVDVDRLRRCGMPEAVYGPGKSPELIASIGEKLSAAGQDLLVTRVDAAQAAVLAARFPEGVHSVAAGTFRWNLTESPPAGRVAVVTAGSTDASVAAEAVETLRWLHVTAELIEDVGVAGPQRLPARVEELRSCDAVIVVAGMEGALPSVVGGHVACPVIACPTSVGYGANLNGLAALLGMLNSCAANVAVVNIDAGFKAGCIAGQIARRAAQARTSQASP